MASRTNRKNLSVCLTQGLLSTDKLQSWTVSAPCSKLHLKKVKFERVNMYMNSSMLIVNDTSVQL